MEPVEQRSMIKYFSIKILTRALHHELTSTLRDAVSSLSQLKCWTWKVKNCDLNCLDDLQPERPGSRLGTGLETLLTHNSFASARSMGRHFSLSPTTVQEILVREIGFRKIGRKWVACVLSSSQRVGRVEGAQNLLEPLCMNQQNLFQSVVTGEKSLFEKI
jgi:hypothetical protein